MAQDRPFIIALPDTGYPPYVVITQEQINGLLVDTVKRALNQSNISYEFRFLPEKRSLKALSEGKVDARMESESWVDNAEQFLWTVPIATIDDVIVSHVNQPVKINHLNDLIGMELITHIGYHYPNLAPYFDKKQIVRSDRYDEEEMLRSLLKPWKYKQRATVMDKNVAQWLLTSNQRFQSNLWIDNYVVASAMLQLQINKTPRNQTIVKRLNAAIVATQHSQPEQK